MLSSLDRHAPAGGLFLAALVIAALSGCADTVTKKVTIKGTIAYKGEPLSSGLLQLVGPEGAYSASPIRPDGTFMITDVVQGELKVGVQEMPRGSKSTGTKSAPVALPEKYRDPQTSGVTYTITSETRDLHIDLK